MFWRRASVGGRRRTDRPNLGFAVDWDLLLRSQAAAPDGAAASLLGAFRVHEEQKTPPGTTGA